MHGKPGSPGLPGRDGRDGREGTKGDQGSPGKIGPQGPPEVMGPAGVNGKDGSKGEPGVQGPPGPKKERGQSEHPGTPDLMSFKNWKECAWKDLNDGKDNGLIKVNDKIVFHSMESKLLPVVLLLISFYGFSIPRRTVCSPRTSLIQLFTFPGQVPLETTSVHPVGNAGILLSTAQNVQLPYPLTVWCTCGTATLKICNAFAILRGIVTIFTKERCAWDSGLVTVQVDREALVTPIQAGSLCPGSSLKKFPRLRPRCRGKTFLP